MSHTFLWFCAAATLAGCTRERDDFVYSFADRYPLGQPRVERIDVSGTSPTQQDATQVARLGRNFARSGADRIVIFVPQAGPGALASGQWVKQELINNGVSARHIQWDARPLPAGTVRVAYSAPSTGEKWTCTNLGEDVQQFENQTSYLNREWENFGCAYQSNMRAQADNPNDFIRPRPEGPIDSVRAANAVRQRRAVSGAAAPTAGAAPAAVP